MNSTQKTTLRTRFARLAPALALSAVMAGCASVPHPSPNDPWESYNRSMYQFNEAVDKAFLKPVAQAYQAVTPEPARTCIHNIFNNFRDIWSAFNSFLQGRGHDGVNMVGRVLFNSTMGLGGCVDVASMNGSKRIVTDLGVTLGVWGVDPGPYVVLPFLGSSSVRDGFATGAALAVDISPLTPAFEIDNIPLRNSILALSAIDLRASLLSADDLVDRIALDRYSFIRDAYIQRRQAQVRGQQFNPNNPYQAAEEDLPDYSIDDDDVPAAAPATSAQ